MPHLLMVWVMEVWRCSPALRAGSCGRDGTRLLSAGMLTLRRNAWRRVGCEGTEGIRGRDLRWAGQQFNMGCLSSCSTSSGLLAAQITLS